MPDQEFREIVIRHMQHMEDWTKNMDKWKDSQPVCSTMGCEPLQKLSNSHKSLKDKVTWVGAGLSALVLAVTGWMLKNMFYPGR